jgi:hypothetical protein
MQERLLRWIPVSKMLRDMHWNCVQGRSGLTSREGLEDSRGNFQTGKPESDGRLTWHLRHLEGRDPNHHNRAGIQDIEDEEAMSFFVGSEGDADTSAIMRTVAPSYPQDAGEMLGRCIAHELVGLRVHRVD